MRAFFSFPAACLLPALALLVLPGCGAEVPTGTYLPYLDPQLVTPDGVQALDLAFPERGVLKAGRNWQPPRRKSRLQRWTTVSEVSRSPSLYFSGFFGGPRDLRLLCSPLGEPAPSGELVPSLNGNPLPAIDISSGRPDWRFTLPQSQILPGINRVDLRFPQKDSAPPGGKRATAVCEGLWLIPKGRQGVTESPGYDEQRARIRLVAGRGLEAAGTGVSALAVPLPGTEAFDLQLGEIRGGSEGSELVVSLRSLDQEEVVWRGPAPSAPSSVRIRKPTAPTRLVLRHAGEGRARPLTLGWGVRSIRPVPDDSTAERGRPDVFVYLIDTLRADALGLYGSDRGTSPKIEAFASDSVMFRNAWSAAAWTLPSVMSALTGVYPSRHGYALARSRPEKPRHNLLTTALGAIGYETVAISQSFVVSEVFGFSRGFDNFYVSDALSRGTSESPAALWFLWEHLYQRREPQKPLFAYIHTVDPHQPYQPKGVDRRFVETTRGSLKEWQYSPEYFTDNNLVDDRHEVARMRALYDGEVAYADRQFGAFISFLKYMRLYENSLIILTADHGEEFAEHGGFGHGHSVFEEQLRVPLLIKFPDSRRAGTQIENRVSLVDLVPTIFEVAGVENDSSELDGMSLVNASASDLAERVVVAQTKKKSGGRSIQVDLTAVAVGTLKCIYGEEAVGPSAEAEKVFRAFDLETDPGETRSLSADSEPGQRCLQELREQLGGDLVLPAERPQTLLSEEQRERLRTLGYLD